MIYWVFIFISITVFGFKVFRENITQTFYLSILGILALLSGAFIVNIMFNLTKISDVLSNEYKPITASMTKLKSWLFFTSFPLVFLLLFFGDFRTSAVKKEKLIEAAEYLVENNSSFLSNISDFKLDSTYFSETEKSLKILTKESESFPSLSIIMEKEISGRTTYIVVDAYTYWNKNRIIADFIYSCSGDERKYLNSVFKDNNNQKLFSSYDGKYELYFPTDTNKNRIVLYFTDRQEYGKLGS